MRFIRNRAFLLRARVNKSLLNNPFFTAIPRGQLFVNWIFQRIFRLNSDVPISVHFSSRVDGFSRMIINKLDKETRISLAVSGGCQISVFENTTLEIGDGAVWAYNVCIQTGNHDFLDRNKYVVSSIKIGKNCWIGNGVTILPGVELGDNVTIGANSVVTKSFPSNVVIAGVPAKLIKSL